MKSRNFKVMILFFFILGACVQKKNESDRVVLIDKADILSIKEEKLLISKVDSLENNTGVQITIVTLKSLKGKSIVSYTNNVFEDFEVGREGVFDGAVILVSMNEKESRLGIGRGLEKTISDDQASQILKENLKPRFKDKLYFQGLSETLDGIGNVLSKK